MTSPTTSPGQFPSSLSGAPLSETRRSAGYRYGTSSRPPMAGPSTGDKTPGPSGPGQNGDVHCSGTIPLTDVTPARSRSDQPQSPASGSQPPLCSSMAGGKRCGIPLVPGRAFPEFYVHTERPEVRHYCVPFRVPADIADMGAKENM